LTDAQAEEVTGDQPLKMVLDSDMQLLANLRQRRKERVDSERSQRG
jgi:hypothetical protein